MLIGADGLPRNASPTGLLSPAGPSPGSHSNDRRPCFLCDSCEGEQLFVESWPIVGMAPVTLGVRVCSGCGLVYQDPVVPWTAMRQYYSLLSNYTNPGRLGLPSRRKVEAVDRQLGLLRTHGPGSGRAFQVGCSDGYTLHRLFREGWSVAGVDPSATAAQVAAARWNLEIEVGFFEDWEPSVGGIYDLCVLTHVLEHIYDPLAVLQKCGRMLRSGGLVLIETPVVEAPERWPPGYFTFEHVNFFSATSMTQTLERAGFELVSPLEIQLDQDEYPILRGVARFLNGSPRHSFVSQPGDGPLTACRTYLEMERKEWARIDGLLGAQLEDLGHAVIWGAGIHSSQLLIKTSVSSCIEIDYFVDRDPQKIGLFLGAYPVRAPEDIDFLDPSLGIIISSHDSEKEIRESILSKSPAARVISLYAG